MSVRAAQLERTESEFRDWLAFNLISPIGDDRGDYRAALVATVSANQYSKKPHRISDFLPKWFRPRATSSSEIGQLLKGLGIGDFRRT
jgi:hypothetical protein